MSSIKLSIITVAYNAEKFIDVTLNSIEKVKRNGLEYVVIDGASKDETLNKVKSRKNLADIVVSEPDKGIYDAMNKGLLTANGEHIVYINAGDEICEEAVNKFFEFEPAADIVYGDAEYVDDNRKSLGLRSQFTSRPLPTILTLDSFKMGQGICHQSFIVRKSLAPSYNLDYKISADYNWMLTCIKRAASNTNLVIPVSKFLHGGVSKQQLRTALKERFWIMVKQFGWPETIKNHLKILFRAAKFYGKNRRLD